MVAKVWGAKVLESMKRTFPDCGRCQDRPTLRSTWGCDGERPKAQVFDVTCSRCAGLVAPVERCPDCKGSGRVPFFQCPGRAVAAAGPAVADAIKRLLDTYIQYDARQVMPVGGAWLDQSASWCQAVGIIDAERGYYEGLREEKIERDRAAAEARAKKNKQTRGARRR